jgi:hypothetical protein
MLEFVVSHPCGKNKNAAWMGHPAFLGLAGFERDFVALIDF